MPTTYGMVCHTSNFFSLFFHTLRVWSGQRAHLVCSCLMSRVPRVLVPHVSCASCARASCLVCLVCSCASCLVCLVCSCASCLVCLVCSCASCLVCEARSLFSLFVSRVPLSISLYLVCFYFASISLYLDYPRLSPQGSIKAL
jgi:hypothetical protein